VIPKPPSPQILDERAQSDGLEDEELRGWMVEYQAGRLDAFDRVYAAVAAPLRRYLTSLTRSASEAQDLLQEAFLQIHRSRRTYDANQPVRPWVFAIARHVYLMSLRSARRRPVRATEPVEGVDVPVPPEVDGLADRLALRAAVARIGADRREAMLLHHVWGFRFREVGAIQGITESAAKLRSSRAMAELRRILGETGEDAAR
jgi:RNA polymerase sigma-70 factor (ECF subfamily)